MYNFQAGCYDGEGTQGATKSHPQDGITFESNHQRGLFNRLKNTQTFFTASKGYTCERTTN